MPINHRPSTLHTVQASPRVQGGCPAAAREWIYGSAGCARWRQRRRHQSRLCRLHRGEAVVQREHGQGQDLSAPAPRQQRLRTARDGGERPQGKLHHLGRGQPHPERHLTALFAAALHGGCAEVQHRPLLRYGSAPDVRLHAVRRWQHLAEVNPLRPGRQAHPRTDSRPAVAAGEARTGASRVAAGISTSGQRTSGHHLALSGQPHRAEISAASRCATSCGSR